MLVSSGVQGQDLAHCDMHLVSSAHFDLLLSPQDHDLSRRVTHSVMPLAGCSLTDTYPSVFVCVPPDVQGQVPAEGILHLVNPCSFPVEVVSLDFDKRYLADEELLRVLDT